MWSGISQDEGVCVCVWMREGEMQPDTQMQYVGEMSVNKSDVSSLTSGEWEPRRGWNLSISRSIIHLALLEHAFCIQPHSSVEY